MTLFSTYSDVDKFADQTQRDTSPQPRFAGGFGQYGTIVEE